MARDVPEMFAAAVEDERAGLWRLVDRLRERAEAGDRAALRALAEELRQRIDDGNSIDRTGGHLVSHLGDIHEAAGKVFDAVFPVRDYRDPADVLDAPWPTPRRVTMLGSIVDRAHWLAPPRDPLVEPAVAAGDVRLLRLLVRSPVGLISRDSAVRVLDALHALGALDTETVEHALHEDQYLGRALLEPPAACLAAVRDVFDELVWRLADGERFDLMPKVLVPRGLRFVLRALRWPVDHPAASFGGAGLTPPERAELVEHLGDQPAEVRRRAFDLRLPAGDAWALLPLLGLAGAESLLSLVQSMSTSDVERQDRAAILAAVDRAGLDTARTLLELCPSELVAATLGWNRAAVLKRVKHNALWGIAAYGMLPLEGDETVQDRYAALHEVAKRGAKLGPNRRFSHAAAVEVALEHLAQVAGFPDAGRLEWECEARIATDAPGAARIGDYTVAVRMDGAEPVIAVSRAGKPLKSTPAAVRADPQYTMLRERQERLRDQARRMRSGLIERLVATGGPLTPEELAGLRRLPSGAALLPALIWRDRADTIGLLDQVDVRGPLTAVHPIVLYERGELSGWQAEIVRRRIRQPVKQAFRELYLLTPAERDAGDVSQRFAGHVVNGKVAGRLLSGRGWSTYGEYHEHQASRPAGPGLTAALACDFHGYFGLGDAIVGAAWFLRDGTRVPLTEVPPIAFSEVMRDLDLVVSVAGTNPSGYASPSHAQSRAQLLRTLIEDLGLTRVTVDGTSAVVRGSRATYRVHLTSGSIHVEPGGYLCVVPASFGGTAHHSLFLPFADEDRMTSVILSKVLLLNDDEHITDPGILAQMGIAVGQPNR
jgi:hypothetical protein